MDIGEVFDKVVEGDDYHLSAEEARVVWLEVAKLFRSRPQGMKLKHLFWQIELEAWEGKRCGVCGEYESPDCRINC